MTPGRKPQPLAERFELRDLGYDTPCRVFTGSLSTGGYGVMTIKRQFHYVHRFVWEQANGPIPKGLHIDHLCHPGDGSCPGGDTCPHRACAEVTHLAVKSCRENGLRGVGPAAQAARRTHCIHGHPFAGANLYIRPNGVRECRTCMRYRWQKAS